MSDSKWFNEALDPRAGLAFASLRGNDGKNEASAAFIAAPHFRPEFLTDGVLGLSAARRSFQAGLYAREREVEFETLEAACEFVRRCYLAGGAGDGGDRDPGFGVPPVPEGAPSWDSELHSLAVSIDEKNARSDGVDYLVDAALVLAAELARRCPRPGEEELAWRRACSHFFSSLERLQILDFVSPAGQRKPWQALAAKAEANLRALAGTHSDFVGWPLIHLFDRGGIRRRRPSASWSRSDPMDLLENLPIPPSVAKSMGVKEPEQVSLQDLLSSFLASPPSTPSPYLELALFAAATLVAESSWHDAWSFSPAREDIAELVTSATTWLDAQMPKQAFDADREKLIAETAGLAY
jgi:hypothetical protein